MYWRQKLLQKILLLKRKSCRSSCTSFLGYQNNAKSYRKAMNRNWSNQKANGGNSAFANVTAIFQEAEKQKRKFNIFNRFLQQSLFLTLNLHCTDTISTVSSPDPFLFPKFLKFLSSDHVQSSRRLTKLPLSV